MAATTAFRNQEMARVILRAFDAWVEAGEPDLSAWRQEKDKGRKADDRKQPARLAMADN